MVQRVQRLVCDSSPESSSVERGRSTSVVAAAAVGAEENCITLLTLDRNPRTETGRNIHARRHGVRGIHREGTSVRFQGSSNGL